MMIYRIARGLQLIGLILVPVAVAGNLAEIADARTALSLRDSLLVAAAGVGCFGLGWWLQQQVKPSG